MVYYGLITFFSFFFPPFLSFIFLLMQDINFNHHSNENFCAKKQKKKSCHHGPTRFSFFSFFLADLPFISFFSGAGGAGKGGGQICSISTR